MAIFLSWRKAGRDFSGDLCCLCNKGDWTQGLTHARPGALCLNCILCPLCILKCRDSLIILPSLALSLICIPNRHLTWGLPVFVFSVDSCRSHDLYFSFRRVLLLSSGPSHYKRPITQDPHSRVRIFQGHKHICCVDSVVPGTAVALVTFGCQAQGDEGKHL